ncbi:MAG: alpha/beta hydrolase [Deltaproteobacteria bacterium]|nr:alpha/beta hydrolase [Deltaproteobacteria bacterium]
MRSWMVILAWILLVRVTFAAPEDPGPLPSEDFEGGSLDLAGAQISVKVYAPLGSSASPLLTLMHGLQRNGSFHADLARTLASRGFVVLVPDMPCSVLSCDHDANAAQLSALIDWGLAQNTTSGLRLFGRIDPDRIGVLGHSWGGLASTLLAGQDARVDALVALDPNDDRGIAAGRAASVAIPSAHLMATLPGRCNGTWPTAVFPTTSEPHLLVRIARAGHCDVESPTNALCDLACGNGDRSTTPYFRRYAVAFLSCVLQADRAMGPYVGGDALGDDQTQGIVLEVASGGLAALPCRSSLADAGTTDTPAAQATDAQAIDVGEDVAEDGAPDRALSDVPIDAEVSMVDAGASTDAGATLDAAGDGADASEGPGPTPASSRGCGCRESKRGPSLSWLLVLALLVRRARG